MTRASSRSSLPRPYVWRLTGVSLQIWSSAWPLDRPDEIAALFAVRECRDETRLGAIDPGRASHGDDDGGTPDQSLRPHGQRL